MLKNKGHIKLGVIGLSEGNGHPYSWSAIFNGYNPKAMAFCPFPVIPEYLSEQTFPDDCIKGASVTHIWTQDLKISEHIAEASKITHVCEQPEDMIGQVDAVLLARDDAENHFEMSRPFLEAGLPVFIDKPLALSREVAEKILDLEQYENQVFTCTALRFASEFEMSADMLEEIGDIESIKAITPKSWEKYGVHIIEPVFKMLNQLDHPNQITIKKSNDTVKANVEWADGISAEFTSMGSLIVPLKVSVYGSRGFVDLVFKDVFSAFRSSLQYFVNLIKGEVPNIPRRQTLGIIDVIEKGSA